MPKNYIILKLELIFDQDQMPCLKKKTLILIPNTFNSKSTFPTGHRHFEWGRFYYILSDHTSDIQLGGTGHGRGKKQAMWPIVLARGNWLSLCIWASLVTPQVSWLRVKCHRQAVLLSLVWAEE